MPPKKKDLKSIAIVVVLILAAIQFYRPERNLSGDNAHDISKAAAVPAPIQAMLTTSCYDCHSNRTAYPWYANIQPVASWLGHHVNEGKEELNFSEFAAYSPRRRYHKLEEIIHTMDEQEMPLASYTLIHRDAVLSGPQRMALSQWAGALRDSMKAAYPADSLKMPKRGEPHKSD